MSDETLEQSEDTELEPTNETEDLDADETYEEPSDEEDNPEEDDGEEFEYEGKKLRLPKGMKDGFLRQDDYTRKSQALADERRNIEQHARSLIEAQQHLVQDHAKVANLQGYVDYYGRVDWDQLEEQDPRLAQTEYRKYQQFQRDLDAAKADLSSKTNTRLHQQRQELQARMVETDKVLGSEIKGWNGDYAKELIKVANKYGVTEKEMLQDHDPRAWRILNALYEAEKGQSKSKLVQTSNNAKSVAPLKTVTGKPAKSNLGDKNLSTDAWMKQRNAQLSKKR